MISAPNPAAEAAVLVAAKTATPPPIPTNDPPAPAPAAFNPATLHAAVNTAITALNTAKTAIANAGTVNSDLQLASVSCQQAITFLTKAAAAAPTV